MQRISTIAISLGLLMLRAKEEEEKSWQRRNTPDQHLSPSGRRPK